jgi:lipopolysaccharide export LptBFGC system permease protein LptF
MFWLNFKLILTYGLMLIALSGIAYICVEYILPYMIKKAKEKEQQARLQDKEKLKRELMVSSIYDSTGRKVG